MFGRSAFRAHYLHIMQGKIDYLQILDTAKKIGVVIGFASC